MDVVALTARQHELEEEYRKTIEIRNNATSAVLRLEGALLIIKEIMGQNEVEPAVTRIQRGATEEPE